MFCAFMQALFFIIFLVKLNWKKATQEALVRAGVQSSSTAQESTEQDHGLDKLGSSQALALEAQECDGFSGEGRKDLERLSREEREGEDGDQQASTTLGEVLSIRQLVMRRLLALLGMLLLLAVGIICSILLPPLLK